MLVDVRLYDDAPSDMVSINSLEIIDDCLIINFSASGCDGDSWVVELIDADEVLESLPPQRKLRLSLENPELCQTIVQKELSFKIYDLRVDGDVVQLNFLNTEQTILYEY